ncbi:MAG: hypothetical protein NXI23_24865 [Bacteroidetes bacterium]|jgi:hypothetical protein|nr:hypothetical protein [Bacteroidota bacterium]MDF1866104.1 hypothetical protein [Saprospiraceae bacterium]
MNIVEIFEELLPVEFPFFIDFIIKKEDKYLVKLLEYALPKLQRSETNIRFKEPSPCADWTDE